MSFIQTRIEEQVYLNHLNQTFSSLLGMLANEELPADEIPALLQVFVNDPQFKAMADMTASRMVTAQKVINARSWRAAAMEGTQGRKIYHALRQEVMNGFDGYVRHLAMQNAELIKTLPRQIARDVNAMILEWTMEGLRADEIAQRLREKVPTGIKTNLQLIARTELSKANSAITQARCQEMDIKWYTWKTANDGDRVRKSHQHMQDVLVQWSNPPNPEALAGVRAPFGRYHAGGCPNCRCYAEPVIAVELLPETVKVYINGEIRRITRKQFMDIATA